MCPSPLAAARAASSALPMPTPDSVRFSPGDCALLVGPTDLLLRRLEAVRLVGLRPSLLCTDHPDLDRLPRVLRALSGELAGLSGWMGAFTATMKGRDGAVDLAPLSFHEDGHFDWVLDFSTPPHIQRPVPPLGYYALPAEDFPALKQALLEIAARLRNGFDKPRYFSFEAQRCAHRRQGMAGCEACLSACPAQAITSEQETIRIEPHLCQGCGTCALVCPAGAVRYAHPSPSFSLSQLRAALAAWRETGGGPAGVWIVKPEQAAETVPEGWLTFEVGETASLGLEFWLAALALGAVRVAVSGHGLAPKTLQAVDQQLGVGNALLAGLGLTATLSRVESSAGLDAIPSLPPRSPAELPGGDDKRELLFAAIDILAGQGEAPVDVIPLPVGAPLGAVQVAAERCTLCAACVRHCPTAALSLPGTTLQLAFTEERCVQCGLCANVCPEKAIALRPRLLTSPAARRAPRVVAKAEPFACTGCGRPFATVAMLERSRAMMAGHPMFQGEQARLMTLCPSCRQKAMVGAPV